MGGEKGLLGGDFHSFKAHGFAMSTSKVGADPLENKRSKARLLLCCEGTLRFLSNAGQADIEAESLCEGCDLRQRVSRARFEDLCEDMWPLLDETLDKALATAGTSREAVGR